MFKIRNCTICTTCGSCQQSQNVDTPNLFCMNCKPSKAPCLTACKYNAIEILGGAITINTNCIQCSACAEVCPLNIIKI